MVRGNMEVMEKDKWVEKLVKGMECVSVCEVDRVE